MGEQNGIAEERRRILRAAADGRLKINGSGRYVIDGEKRPDRKVRERLMYHDPQFVAWPRHDLYCRITVDGRGELRDLEAMLGTRDDVRKAIG